MKTLIISSLLIVLGYVYFSYDNVKDDFNAFVKNAITKTSVIVDAIKTQLDKHETTFPFQQLTKY